MIKQILSWLGILALFFFEYGVAQAALPDTLARVKLSIVGVGTHQAIRSPATRLVGTGFVVADGRHVITNAHNIVSEFAEKESLAVLIPDEGERYMRLATLIARDDDHDLALLKFSDSPLPALSLGDSRHVREGESYAFTGFPLGESLGLRPVTHRGMISAITPIIMPVNSDSQLNAKLIKRMRSPFMVFQLDATAYPGNSGSPVFDMETGEVIGVVNSVFVKGSKENAIEHPSGISYAIPGQFVRDLLIGAKLIPLE
ncbi:MAG: trypsin-like peptidase domain-containing protein [Gammaproteobacteria bacterium]|nr:trypsin-like peptidase domain-containing protein [Gammaproteobacteria bacterium]